MTVGIHHLASLLNILRTVYHVRDRLAKDLVINSHISSEKTPQNLRGFRLAVLTESLLLQCVNN